LSSRERVVVKCFCGLAEKYEFYEDDSEANRDLDLGPRHLYVVKMSRQIRIIYASLPTFIRNWMPKKPCSDNSTQTLRDADPTGSSHSSLGMIIRPAGDN